MFQKQKLKNEATETITNASAQDLWRQSGRNQKDYGGKDLGKRRAHNHMDHKRAGIRRGSHKLHTRGQQPFWSCHVITSCPLTLSLSVPCFEMVISHKRFLCQRKRNNLQKGTWPLQTVAKHHQWSKEKVWCLKLFCLLVTSPQSCCI